MFYDVVYAVSAVHSRNTATDEVSCPCACQYVWRVEQFLFLGKKYNEFINLPHLFTDAKYWEDKEEHLADWKVRCIWHAFLYMQITLIWLLTKQFIAIILETYNVIFFEHKVTRSNALKQLLHIPLGSAFTMLSERAVNYIPVYTQRLTESEGRRAYCCGYLPCHPPKMHCPPSSISFEGEAVQVTVSWRVFTQLFSGVLAHSTATYPLCIQLAGTIPTPSRTISLCNFSTQ